MSERSGARDRQRRTLSPEEFGRMAAFTLERARQRTREPVAAFVVTLSQDELDEIKHCASVEGMAMGELVLTAIEHYLDYLWGSTINEYQEMFGTVKLD